MSLQSLPPNARISSERKRATDFPHYEKLFQASLTFVPLLALFSPWINDFGVGK